MQLWDQKPFDYIILQSLHILVLSVFTTCTVWVNVCDNYSVCNLSVLSLGSVIVDWMLLLRACDHQWVVLWDSCCWFEACLGELSPPSLASSFAYISSINPVLCELLWSLCMLWAMVIICLLRSHCFIRHVCSLLPILLPLSCSLCISVALTACSPLLCYSASTSALYLTHFHLLHHSTSFPLLSSLLSLSSPSLFSSLLSFKPLLLLRCKHNSLIHKAAQKPPLRKLLM